MEPMGETDNVARPLSVAGMTSAAPIVNKSLPTGTAITRKSSDNDDWGTPAMAPHSLSSMVEGEGEKKEEEDGASVAHGVKVHVPDEFEEVEEVPTGQAPLRHPSSSNAWDAAELSAAEKEHNIVRKESVAANHRISVAVQNGHKIVRKESAVAPRISVAVESGRRITRGKTNVWSEDDLRGKNEHSIEVPKEQRLVMSKATSVGSALRNKEKIKQLRRMEAKAAEEKLRKQRALDEKARLEAKRKEIEKKKEEKAKCRIMPTAEFSSKVCKLRILCFSSFGEEKIKIDHNNNRLEFYDPRTGRLPKECNICNGTISRCNDTEFSFTAFGASGKTYTFRSPTKLECDNFINALEKALHATTVLGFNISGL